VAKRKKVAKEFPLHAAARRGDEKDVRKFLVKTDVVVDAKDTDGFTPFALACRGRHVG
jgi:ankyrin repeat protein